MRRSERFATSAFAAIMLSIVGILIVPLPSPVLDLLLALNILGSGVVLILSVTVADPLEFSAFAPALLVATLFRLALDVSATRLILTQGHLPGGVGEVIPAFGAFVVRGNLVVGLIVFAILITIQFIVIASGSQRVAEVAARFTLDAMPGKQMAIDADVHAGMLDIEKARHTRALVQKEADFYGAMDGAGKFVKGDAIAALVIVALNLVGGVIVGVADHGLSPLEALSTFALLTIGNALVTTLPAFLLSTAMGLMVTRVAASGSLGLDLASQVLARPDALRAAGVLALGLALVPALPGPLFAVLGLLLLAAGWLAARRRRDAEREAAAAREQAKRVAIRRPETALGLLGVDALAVEFGPELCAALLASPNGEALLDRIGDVRRALAGELGLVLPGVRLRDDLMREPDGYAVRVRGELAGEGRLRPGALLAIAEPSVLARIGGEPAVDPVYGLAGRWIEPAHRDAAQQAGALLFDAVSVIGSHLAEVARRRAASLLGRQELQTMIEHLRASVPTLVKEIGGEALPLATVQRVLHELLRERVWPRDPVATLEAIVDAAATTREPRELVESARRSLVPAQLRRRGLPRLAPLILAPELETELAAVWSPESTLAAPRPELALQLRSQVEAHLARAGEEGAAVVCTAAVRGGLAQILRRLGVHVPVYSYVEIPPEIELVPAGVVSAPSSRPQ